MHYLLVNIICALTLSNASSDVERAQQTLDALYQNYAAPNTCLLRENYPFNQDNKATYLASEEQAKRRNEYSYLWPYSGTSSAVNALLESTGNKKYKKLLENKVLPGLEEYFDTRREPFAYSSYISSQPLSDRFYDDNVWLGIDFTDSYRMTGKQAYLEKAKLIWKFILSGKDDVLGGGIYWCEQKKESKNTCSNAPGAVFALKLFQATQDDAYLKEGKELYEWTKKNLEDPKDHLYFDNISLNKKSVVPNLPTTVGNDASSCPTLSNYQTEKLSGRCPKYSRSVSQTLLHSFHLSRRTNVPITEKRKYLVHSSYAKRFY